MAFRSEISAITRAAIATLSLIPMSAMIEKMMAVVDQSSLAVKDRGWGIDLANYWQISCYNYVQCRSSKSQIPSGLIIALYDMSFRDRKACDWKSYWTEFAACPSSLFPPTVRNN